MFEKRKSLKDTGTPAPHEEVNPVEESMEELEAAEVSALEEVSQELSRGETSQENAPADQPQEAPGEGSQEEETSQGKRKRFPTIRHMTIPPKIPMRSAAPTMRRPKGKRSE